MGLTLNLGLHSSRADASSCQAGGARSRRGEDAVDARARRGNARGPEGTANAPYGRSCPRSAASSAGCEPTPATALISAH